MIKLDAYFLFGVITLSGHSVTTDRICEPTDACSCKFTDTKKVVSLHAIDNGNPPPPRFNNKVEADDSRFTFDYNPCTPFNSLDGKGCTNQLVCQYWERKNAYGLANPKSLNIPSVKNNQVIFKYTGDLQEGVRRSVEITLECDKNKNTPEMNKPSKKSQDKSNAVFKFTVATKCACEGACSTHDAPADKKKLSIGTILCIVLLVLVVVYIFGGIVFLKYYKKKEGTEVIPNRDFWTDFPSKVKDGCKFTYSKIKRKNEYESI